MFTKIFFVFFLSTIFIYDAQAGAPSVDICAKPLYIFYSLLGKLQTVAQKIVDQGIQQINAYAKSNKKESPKKFEDDINLIVNNVFGKVQDETNKILKTLVANFPSITSTNAESYFFGGSPAGWPLSCFDVSNLQNLILDSFQRTSVAANGVIDAHH